MLVSQVHSVLTNIANIDAYADVCQIDHDRALASGPSMDLNQANISTRICNDHWLADRYRYLSIDGRNPSANPSANFLGKWLQASLQEIS